MENGEEKDKKGPGGVLAETVASMETERWAKHKRLRPKKRETYKDSLRNMNDAFVDGLLTMDDKCNITFHLQFPVGEGGKTTELVFVPRLSVEQINDKLKTVDTDDSEGRIIAMVSALTGKPAAVVSKLDSEDNSICSAIAVFFF